MGNCLSARIKQSHLEVAELRSAEVASLLATQERDLAGVKKELELSNAERDLAVIDASAHRERIQQLEAQYSISEQEWQKQIFELQSELEQRETALSEQRRLPESRTKQGGALREELEQMEDGKKKVEEELQELQESKETLVQQHEVRRSRMKELYQSKMKESSDKVRQLEADITSLKYSNNELATAKILMGVKLSKAKRSVQELSKGITDAGPDSSEASAAAARESEERGEDRNTSQPRIYPRLCLNTGAAPPTASTEAATYELSRSLLSTATDFRAFGSEWNRRFSNKEHFHFPSSILDEHRLVNKAAESILWRGKLLV